MPTIALLRAVNVGRRKVEMAELRAVFERLGLGRVRTYIASGNVVFDGEVDVEPLERAIAEAFGFPVEVALRSADALRAILSANPFPDAETEPAKLHLIAACRPVPPGLADRVAAVRTDGERLAPVGQDLVAHYVNGVGRSKVTAAALDRALGVPGTGRNWNTVRKLVALADERG